MNVDKTNPFYRELKVIAKVTLAEATIAWFYSGKRQPLIDVEMRFPVYADGEFNCTDQLQAAVNYVEGVFIPSGEFKTIEPILFPQG